MKLFKKLRLSSTGFSHVELFFGVLIIAAIAGVGIRVLNASNAASTGTVSIKITAPTKNATVSKKVTVKTVVSNNTAKVAGVITTFYENAAGKSTSIGKNTNFSGTTFSPGWTTTKVANGTYRLYSVLVLSTGKTGIKSPVIAVKVNNTAPTAPPTTTTPPTTTIACTNKLTGSQTVSLEIGNIYTLQANEFDSSAAMSICNNTGVDFQVASSSIAQTGTEPGAYPSLFKGCHFGNCTNASSLPLPVSTMTGTPGTVNTSYSTTTISSGKWDDAYDVWYNPAKTTTNNETGLEMMIWLNHTTGANAVQPIGAVVASNVSIAGHVWNVWHGVNGGTAGTVTYVLATPNDTLSNFDLGLFAKDAVSRGYLTPSDFLIDVEAGFEIWNGGAGLTANSFLMNVQ